MAGNVSDRDIELGHIVVRAAVNGHDLESLTRPLLEALAKLANLESTYLTVFDWDSREQEVRFVHSTGEIQIAEGTRIAVPEDLVPEALPGVTRSPRALTKAHPDSKFARRLGLESYVSVPVTVAEHRLFGMLCGASLKPRQVGEPIVTVMEFFAQIIADHVTRTSVAATERRAAAAEERLRTRARFLAEAEHKLKGPLTVLTWTPSMLLERWAEMRADRRIELLAAMDRNARDLARLIDEMLLEARSDVRARELVPVPVEITPLVQRIAGVFASVSASHKVAVEGDEGIVARVDPAGLHQVLGLLLDNAIKYSPAGGAIALRVATTAGGVQVEVTDAGVGVPDGVDIFEPFVRGDLGVTEGVPGIGLGLHIVRNLVEAMGGSVSARRNAGPGSTFTVRVPSTS